MDEFAYHRLDFEQLQRLAREDPEAFESHRQELIDSAIARAPEARRKRLRGLQWRADQVRQRATSPMAACITLSDMMWESFAGSDGLVERLRYAGRRSDAHQAGGRMASVVPLSRARGGEQR